MKILLQCRNLMTRAQLEGTWRNAGAEVLGPAQAREAELAVIDLQDTDALERIRAIHTELPELEILAFGPHVDGEAFAQAKAAGASKGLARSAIVDAVLRLLHTR